MRFTRKVVPVTALILGLCLVTGLSAYGNGITGKGLRLGAAWGSLNTNHEEFDAGTAGGFTGGVFLTYGLTPRLSVQPELMYVSKGTGSGSLFGNAGYDFDYIELPVLLKYTLAPNTRVIPSVFAGPTGGVLVSAEIYHDGLFYNNYRNDVSDGMKSTDFGIVVGAEFEFNNTKAVHIVVDCRYTFGLVNVIDPQEWNDNQKIVDEGDSGLLHWEDYDRPLIPEGASAKNRAFAVTVGVRF